ncbi:MAG TPA: hypothetical protein VHV30_15080 [Polyangiaceae bacterium]|jgi:hypothetical protein|nr:hypothetical protein [Polyangiaceae bacterium]
MPIIGSTPESGVRIDVSRPREGGPPWRYEGEAVTPEATFAVTAGVDESGETSVEVSPRPSQAATDLIVERVRLLLRAAYKHAREDGQPPPRRIVRWRPDAQK